MRTHRNNQVFVIVTFNWERHRLAFEMYIEWNTTPGLSSVYDSTECHLGREQLEQLPQYDLTLLESVNGCITRLHLSYHSLSALCEQQVGCAALRDRAFGDVREGIVHY